jgi:hypothetical protein
MTSFRVDHRKRGDIVAETSGTAGYGTTAKTLHWIAAFCVVVAWRSALFIDDFPKSANPSPQNCRMSCSSHNR